MSIAVSNFAFGMVFDQLCPRRRVALVFGLMATMTSALVALLNAKVMPQYMVLALIGVAGLCFAPVYWVWSVMFGGCGCLHASGDGDY